MADFFKELRKHSMGENCLFNKCCWENWIVTGKPHTIYSKWTKELNVTNKTTKLLEENFEVNLHDLEFRKRLYMTLKA